MNWLFFKILRADLKKKKKEGKKNTCHNHNITYANKTLNERGTLTIILVFQNTTIQSEKSSNYTLIKTATWQYPIDYH